MKIIETWESVSDKLWATLDKVIAYMANNKIGPAAAIYPPAILLGGYEMRNLLDHAEFQKEIFRMTKTLSTASRFVVAEARGRAWRAGWSEQKRLAYERLRPIRFVKRGTRMSTDVLESYVPAAGDISGVLADACIPSKVALAVLAGVVVHYRVAVGLSPRAAGNDLAAAWDYYSARRRRKVINN